MSDSAPVVEQPAEAPPVEEAPVVEAATPDPEPVTDDAALAAQIEATAVAIPDGERLVPESTLRNVAISYRNKLKEAKQGSPDAVALKAELDRVNAQLQQVTPMAQAFHAIQQAQQHQPQQPQQPAPVENTADLEDIARDFDFYKADGAPDLDRARRVQARTTKQAEAIAQQQMAPLVNQSLQERAATNIQRMKNTKLGNEGADPAIIDSLVAQIARQPNGMATLADPESAKHLWVNAYGQTQAMRALKGGQTPAVVPAPVVPIPPALVTERSGGQTVSQPRVLSPLEKRAAKEAGLSEKDYLDVAKKMPW